MSQQDISQEEISLLRQIKNQQAYINELFKQLDLKDSEISKSSNSINDKPKIQQEPIQKQKSQYIYLKRYQDFDLSKVRKAYQQAFLPFKWYQLPFCRKIIYDKCLFCLPSGLALTIIFLFYKNMGKNKIEWSIKTIGRFYIPITLGCLGLSFVESLFNQSYCDINSHHYNENLPNLQKVKLSKKYLDQISYNQPQQKLNKNKN